MLRVGVLQEEAKEPVLEEKHPSGGGEGAANVWRVKVRLGLGAT